MLVSRFGTSGALSECVFQRFVEANGDWFPLRFAQLEEAASTAGPHTRNPQTKTLLV